MRSSLSLVFFLGKKFLLFTEYVHGLRAFFSRLDFRRSSESGLYSSWDQGYPGQECG